MPIGQSVGRQGNTFNIHFKILNGDNNGTFLCPLNLWEFFDRHVSECKSLNTLWSVSCNRTEICVPDDKTEEALMKSRARFV